MDLLLALFVVACIVVLILAGLVWLRLGSERSDAGADSSRSDPAPGVDRAVTRRAGPPPPSKSRKYLTDQFLLGEDVLVAPVLTPGATTRRVVLPRGRWTPIGTALGGAAEVVVGDDPAVLDLPVQLGTLPVWRRAA